MKVGVIGSGTVGQTLAAGFAGRGHEVILGTREPGAPKIQEWVAKTGQGVKAATLAETAAFADLAIVATAWEGTENALRLAGPKNLAGKVVVDVTNPLDASTGQLRLAVGFTDSGGESVQRWLPGAKVVKAWNIVTAYSMIDPQHEEGKPDMFIAGDDAAAKAQVSEILQGFGWGVVDCGGIEKARYLEPLAMLWIDYYIAHKTSAHAFKLLRK